MQPRAHIHLQILAPHITPPVSFHENSVLLGRAASGVPARHSQSARVNMESVLNQKNNPLPNNLLKNIPSSSNNPSLSSLLFYSKSCAKSFALNKIYWSAYFWFSLSFCLSAPPCPPQINLLAPSSSFQRETKAVGHIPLQGSAPMGMSQDHTPLLRLEPKGLSQDQLRKMYEVCRVYTGYLSRSLFSACSLQRSRFISLSLSPCLWDVRNTPEAWCYYVQRNASCSTHENTRIMIHKKSEQNVILNAQITCRVLCVGVFRTVPYNRSLVLSIQFAFFLFQFSHGLAPAT